MHIEPVIPDFQSVKIRRSGGFAGVDERLHIDEQLAATVEDRMRGDHAFELDAFEAQELMHALNRLLQVNPAPSSAKGRDFFRYDIELTVGGRTHTFHSVDVGADEALHGVMLAANNLVRTARDEPVHIMDLHMEPATS